MVKHVSATERSDTSQVTNSASETIKRRAHFLINDPSIDGQSRAVICYGLKTNDPWLAELVHRVDDGETVSAILESKRSGDPPPS